MFPGYAPLPSAPLPSAPHLAICRCAPHPAHPTQRPSPSAPLPSVPHPAPLSLAPPTQRPPSSDSDSGLRSGTGGEDAELECDGDSESDASVEFLSQPPPWKQQLKVGREIGSPGVFARGVRQVMREVRSYPVKSIKCIQSCAIPPSSVLFGSLQR